MANGQPWTPEDSATLCRMAASGASDREIADHMGRDVKLVGRKRRDLKVKRGVSPALAAMLGRLKMRRRKVVRV